MKKLFTVFVLLCAIPAAKAQPYYFPPAAGNQWDTVSPQSLNWCTGRLDTVYKYLAAKNTKGFIILKGGKIAVERYFDNFTRDSLWYWASAGKTITSFLIGVAQQEGKLDINDTTSRYLGSGWTQCTPAQEGKITIRHQLTMTTGLDDAIPPTVQVPDPDNCLQPECMQYKADAGTRWAYHNAPYRILQDVIDSATGQNMNQYTQQKLRNTTGMQGIWFDYIYYSRLRDMARFGSLIINKGKWASTVVLADTAYLHDAVNTSQNINPSYGYLWWLNGKAAYKVPGLQLSFNGPLVPNAPAGMYAALGKNDQKLYIIPEMDIVIARMGNASGQPVAAVSSFDNELWGLLKDVFCPNGPVGMDETASEQVFLLYPNPASALLYTTVPEGGEAEITDIAGRTIYRAACLPNVPLDIAGLHTGIYTVRITTSQAVFTTRFIKE